MSNNGPEGAMSAMLKDYVIVNAWVCTCYEKYHEGIMIVPKGEGLEGNVVIPEGYFS